VGVIVPKVYPAATLGVLFSIVEAGAIGIGYPWWAREVSVGWGDFKSVGLLLWWVCSAGEDGEAF
jgi:hypothetical protein